jgi:hypothetical protein
LGVNVQNNQCFNHEVKAEHGTNLCVCVLQPQRKLEAFHECSRVELALGVHFQNNQLLNHEVKALHHLNKAVRHQTQTCQDMEQKPPGTTFGVTTMVGVEWWWFQGSMFQVNHFLSHEVKALPRQLTAHVTTNEKCVFFTQTLQVMKQTTRHNLCVTTIEEMRGFHKHWVRDLLSWVEWSSGGSHGEFP